jgi:hypothetical protein
LQSVYSEAGYPEEATRYGELADRYEQRSKPSASADSIVELAAAPAETDAEEIPIAAPTSAPWPSAATQPAEELEFSVVAEENVHQDQEQDQSNQDSQPVNDALAVAESHPAPAEIDLSSEWDDDLTIEGEEPAPEVAEIEITDTVADHEISAAELETPTPQQGNLVGEKTTESVEEIRFYLEHGMPEQAAAAFKKLQALSTDEATLDALRAEIESASQPTSVVEDSSAVETVSEFTIDEPSAEFTVDEIPAAGHEDPVVVEKVSTALPASVAHVPAPPVVAPPALHVQPLASEPAALAPPPVAAPGVLHEFVSDLESSLGENFLPGALSHESAPAVEHASQLASRPEHIVQSELEPVGNATPTSFGVPQTAVIGEFVADLEASLGEDFLKDAPVAEPEPAPQSQPVVQTKAPSVVVPAQQWPAPTPARASVVKVPTATAAAAASSGTPTISSQASAPVPHQSVPAPAAPVPQISPIIPGAPTAAKSSPFGEDAGVDLAEMFGELKQDLESGSSAQEEDPETHYNLGIAFREMGLLDEAIGELQKTCQAVDRGHPFPQAMQTYTWLAQCFLDKGVPEAAIRWYQKALNAPGIDEETRTALHYELAGAYEAAGDRPSALKHFMEVYGRNIDYRDVAERIKPLKS